MSKIEKIDIAAALKGRIGCSEISAAIGVSPWMTPFQLWQFKTGKVARPDIGGMLRVKIGTKIEQAVAELVAEKTGWKIKRNNKEYFDQALNLVGHIDRDAVIAPKQIEGLEIKTSLGRFTDHEWGPDGGNEVPVFYIPQVYGYMHLTKRKLWHVAALLAGPELRMYTVHWEQEMWDMIREGLVKFNQCVDTDTAPEITTLEDISRLWPNSCLKSEPATAAALAYVQELREVKAEIKELEEQADALELLVKGEIQDAEALIGDDGRTLCTWKSSTRKTFDSKALTAELPEIAEKYSKTTETRTFRLAKEKK